MDGEKKKKNSVDSFSFLIDLGSRAECERECETDRSREKLKRGKKVTRDSCLNMVGVGGQQRVRCCTAPQSSVTIN